MMSGLLKTLLGGAAGVAALYVVGKVCYEAGRDVAEIERQLNENPARDDAEEDAGVEGGQMEMELDTPEAEPTKEKSAETEKRQNVVAKAVDKVRNLKAIVRVKQAFSGGGREPGVLGTLLKNPEGARIEAFVANGGVRINVRPRAA